MKLFESKNKSEIILQNINTKINNKELIDWRLKENRLEGFSRYFYWRTQVQDLDHYWWTKHFTEGMDFNQKFWYSFQFGRTYRSPQAYVYAYLFPDLSKIDVNKMQEWHSKNWKKCIYNTDTRYHKGHFVNQYLSLREWLGNKTPYDKIMPLVEGKDNHKNFLNVWAECQKWHKFGRMTGWLFCQCLYENTKIPIEPDTMWLEYPAESISQWNGLIYCRAKEDTMKISKKDSTYKPSKKDIEWAVNDVLELRAYLRNRFKDIYCEMYSLETALCQYKKLFVRNDYPGHSTAEIVSLYERYKEVFPEVDWSKYKKAKDTLPFPMNKYQHVKDFLHVFFKTGQLINIDTVWKDMPNVYSLLELSPTYPETYNLNIKDTLWLRQ